MIQCIQYRKSTFLGSLEWLTLPWSDVGKDIYQQLYDKGFVLAALLEGMDNAGFTNGNNHISMLSELLGCLSRLDKEMSFWFQRIQKESSSPLYWHDESLSHSWHSEGALQPCKLPPFAFRNLLLANTIVAYWGLQLVLSNTIALACEHVLSMSPQISAQSSSNTSPRTFQDLQTISLQLLEAHAGPCRLELATNIVRSMPYCLNDDMGLMGAQKSLFAMRVSLFELQSHPHKELKWCQAMYQDLYSRKGLRYAREIAKLVGKFSAAGKDEPLRP